MEIFLILMIPLMGTTLGSLMVFLMRDKVRAQTEKLLLGFASGVMIAASVWSLLIPSMELSEQGCGKMNWVPAVVGFAAVFQLKNQFSQYRLILIKVSLCKSFHISDKPEGMRSGLSKTTMMLLAVTIHNVPEGMAVGAAVAGSTGTGGDSVTLASTFALALGIAIQNFPEGAVVSMPLKSEGMKKGKAFVMGVLSGVVEPIGAAVMILLASFIAPLLPYMLSFAAGAMMYVVIEELIPEAQGKEHSNIGTIGAAAGFVVMMVLDCTLG